MKSSAVKEITPVIVCTASRKGLRWWLSVCRESWWLISSEGEGRSTLCLTQRPVLTDGLVCTCRGQKALDPAPDAIVRGAKSETCGESVPHLARI
jgi:hypothetical protein